MVQRQGTSRYRIFLKLNTKLYLYVSSFWFYFYAVQDTCAVPLPKTPNVFKSEKSRCRKSIHTLDRYCSCYTFNYNWTPSETKRNTIWIKDAKSTCRENMSIPGNSKSSKSKATDSMQEVTRVVLSRCDMEQAETLHTVKNCVNIGWIKG